MKMMVEVAVEVIDEGDGDPGAAAAPPPLLRHRGGSRPRSRQVLGFLPKQPCGEQGELQLLKLPPDPEARGNAKAPGPCSVPDGKALKLSSLTARGAGEEAPLPHSLAPFLQCLAISRIFFRNL